MTILDCLVQREYKLAPRLDFSSIEKKIFSSCSTAYAANECYIDDIHINGDTVPAQRIFEIYNVVIRRFMPFKNFKQSTYDGIATL